MLGFGLALAAICAAYIFGFWDGSRSRPPPPLRGNYESQDADDRVEDYPDDWV